MEKWFQLAIAQGLRSLVVLSLDRTPAAEVLPETIRAWVDDLWTMKSWEIGDESRIDHAFRVLRRSSRMWPQMVDFLACLPDRPKPAVLPPPEISDEEREARRVRNLEALEDLKRRIGL